MFTLILIGIYFTIYLIIEKLQINGPYKQTTKKNRENLIYEPIEKES